MLNNLPESLLLERDALELCIKAFCEVLQVEKIYLFGSHCQGTARPDSDVDLCVVAQGVDSQLKAAQTLRKSTRGIGRKPAFTLVPISVERLREKQENKDPFYLTILKEGVVIAQN